MAGHFAAGGAVSCPSQDRREMNKLLRRMPASTDSIFVTFAFFNFSPQQIMERDQSEDLAVRTIQLNDELAGGFDQQSLQVTDRLLAQAGSGLFQFGRAIFH